MPEDLPKAVLVLLWLLTGVIILGYLIMVHTMLASTIFIMFYFGAPVWLYQKRKKARG